MLTPLDAVVGALVFIVPGVLFELGIEREVGFWRTGFGDRTLRFVAVSAVVHVTLSPVTVTLVNRYFDGHDWGSLDTMPVPLWLYLLALIIGLYLLGLVVGGAAHRGREWPRIFMGRDAAPRAWDFLFGRRGRTGYVRIKLRDGGWVGGVWALGAGRAGPSSYASSYPQAEDLYLAAQITVDPDTGAFVLDEEGQPAIRPWGILVTRDEIERLEFQEANTLTDEGGDP